MATLTAEIRKLRTTRTTWAVTAVALALVVLQVWFVIFFTAFTGPWTGTPRDIADAIDQVSVTFPIALVVGVLSMTTEFRYGTIGRTLQLTPSRTRVIVAKIVAGAGYALLLTLLGLVIVGAMVGLAALRTDVTLTLGGEVGRALWQAPVGLALVTMLGVALGALLRSQVLAITVSLVWVLLVEQLLLQFLPRIGQWLPFSALQAMFVSEEMRAAMPEGATLTMLSPLTGLVVFIGYVVVVVAAAVPLLRYRDV